MSDPSSTSRPPKTPHIHEAAGLREYVREGGVPAASGCSTFGAMCDILLAQGWASIRCPSCKRRAKRRRAKRTRDATLGPSRTELLFREAGWSLDAARVETDRIADARCHRCHGVGRVTVRITRAMLDDPEIDCWPTGSSVKGKAPATVGGGDDLERMGRVGNLLVRMRERDPEGAEALEIWRAPGGSAFGAH